MPIYIHFWNAKVGIEEKDFATSSTTPFEKLQRMGFSSDEIQRASVECSMISARLCVYPIVYMQFYFYTISYYHIIGSMDFDELLEYLLDENENVLEQKVRFFTLLVFLSESYKTITGFGIQ